jgi:hypothetical protein
MSRGGKLWRLETEAYTAALGTRYGNPVHSENAGEVKEEEAEEEMPLYSVPPNLAGILAPRGWFSEKSLTFVVSRGGKVSSRKSDGDKQPMIALRIPEDMLEKISL